MNCWKSVYISREYRTERLVMISAMTTLSYFIIFYLSFNLLTTPPELVEYGFLAFIIGVILIFPIHQLLHCIPVWLAGKKAKCGIRFTHLSPVFYSQIKETTSRNLSIISVAAPALIVTASCVAGAYALPQYLHYFAIFSALNIGLCVVDFIYLKQLLHAPKQSYVEDFPDGFHILIQRSA